MLRVCSVVYGCVCTRVYRYTHLYAHTWRLQINTRRLALSPSIFIFEAESLLDRAEHHGRYSTRMCLSPPLLPSRLNAAVTAQVPEPAFV